MFVQSNTFEFKPTPVARLKPFSAAVKAAEVPATPPITPVSSGPNAADDHAAAKAALPTGPLTFMDILVWSDPFISLIYFTSGLVVFGLLTYVVYGNHGVNLVSGMPIADALHATFVLCPHATDPCHLFRLALLNVAHRHPLSWLQPYRFHCPRCLDHQLQRINSTCTKALLKHVCQSAQSAQQSVVLNGCGVQTHTCNLSTWCVVPCSPVLCLAV